MSFQRNHPYRYRQSLRKARLTTFIPGSMLARAHLLLADSETLFNSCVGCLALGWRLSKRETGHRWHASRERGCHPLLGGRHGTRNEHHEFPKHVFVIAFDVRNGHLFGSNLRWIRLAWFDLNPISVTATIAARVGWLVVCHYYCCCYCPPRAEGLL